MPAIPSGQHTPSGSVCVGPSQGCSHRFMLTGLTFMWLQGSDFGFSHMAQQALYMLRQFLRLIFKKVVTRTFKMMFLGCVVPLGRGAN